jgi:glutathione-regulated potassium-efflux system ancillary protein KefG
MKKILILFAHPAFHKSQINKALIQSISDIDGVTINNLYENYPDFFINVKKEQELLIRHDLIVWHHPFYWYSAPSIIKEWMDLVLEHGFAYGHDGRNLEGKRVLSVISTGGKKEVYSEEGYNHYTINQFLYPFKQSASLCRMTYLPPFVVHGSHTISNKEIKHHSELYRKLIEGFRDESIDQDELLTMEYANDIFREHV